MESFWHKTTLAKLHEGYTGNSIHTKGKCHKKYRAILRSVASGYKVTVFEQHVLIEGNTRNINGRKAVMMDDSCLSIGDASLLYRMEFRCCSSAASQKPLSRQKVDPCTCHVIIAWRLKETNTWLGLENVDLRMSIKMKYMQLLCRAVAACWRELQYVCESNSIELLSTYRSVSYKRVLSFLLKWGTLCYAVRTTISIPLATLPW